MKTIVIDPGHGGSDPGANYNGHREKDFNLAIALKVRDFLQKNHEVNLLMTRDKDTTMSLQQRTDFANAKNADFYLSIHINAGGGTGFESYLYYTNLPQATVMHRQVIHDSVMAAVKTKYTIVDRGKKKANFHVLRETKMSAILIEVLFIDNKKDLALLTNPAFISDFSVGLAKGVAKALALPVKSSSGSSSDTDSSSLYKVIAGSFKERKNAEERVQFLKTKGMEAFVTPIVVSGSQFYRAQAGLFSSRENAEKQIAALKQIGVPDVFILSADEPEKVVSPTQPTTPAEPNKPAEPTKPTEPTTPAEPTPPSAQTPTGLNAIKGSSVLLASQLDDFAKSVNPAAPELGKYYLKYGEIYGIKGDIAFAQAIHETNYFRFTGSVQNGQNNFAGLGATSATATGASFPTPEDGVHAHIQHLFAYAATEPIPQGYQIIDPRFQYVTRGSAPTWTELNGKWAVPGTTYGQMILAIYKKMIQVTLEDLDEQEKMLTQLLGEF